MAFTVTFQTTGEPPGPETLAAWLTQHGEPFETETPQELVLRALPVRMRLQDAGPMQAHVDVTPTVPLMRLVDLLFDLSMLAGADVRLAGVGDVNRARLWMELADEQDRQRITAAIATAEEHGNKPEVLKRLWSMLAVLQPGHDIRWNVDRHAIVEMLEVGESISLDEAAWHVEDPVLGDIVPTPVKGYLHILAWRWLSEAYPGLTQH